MSAPLSTQSESDWTERVARRRRIGVLSWSAITVICGVLWIATRNGLYLLGALVYGATAVVLARRLQRGAPGPSADSNRADS